jgi:hypothetical protein
MILFSCDLSQDKYPIALPASLQVEQKRHDSELGPGDRQTMTALWSSKLVLANMRERFQRGAVLWLIRVEGTLAGYGWTLRGRTIEPHYFPVGVDDVHLFDFHVLPQFRGLGMNPTLVKYILGNLAAAGGRRALIEAAEWNSPQLSSLSKTPFRRIGQARKYDLFDRTIVVWRSKEAFSGVSESPGQSPPQGARKETATAHI